MSQGCVRFVLLSATVFAALAMGWAFALRPAGSEAPLEKAAILALLGAGTVLSVKSLLKQRSEIRLLEDAARGIPPEHGKRGAAVGVLQPTTGAVLTAPFSGEPALLYAYAVSRMADFRTGSGKVRKTSVKAYEGEAMAPCEVKTAWGGVRILEPPVLAAARKTWKGPEAVARAEAWFASAAFHEVVSPGTVGAVRRKVEAEERESLASTGGFRYDGRISNPAAILESPVDLREWELDEARFAPGETVTVLGRYDESRGGFTAVPTDVLAGVALYAGGVAETVGRKRTGIRFLGGLAVALLVAQAFVGGEELRARLEEGRAAAAATAAIPVTVRLFSAVEKGDTDAVSRLLRKGADPAARDGDGRTLAHAAPDEAMLKLVLDAGCPADRPNGWGATPLILAAGDGDLGRVRLLLGRSVDPNAIDDAGANALSHAVDPGVRAALAAAGARDLFGSPPPSPAPPR